MRRLLYPLHKFSGLLLGLLLALIGLSGSLLVFDHALDEQLTPELRHLPADQSGSLQTALERAREAALPNYQATRIYLARQPGAPHTIRFSNPDITDSRLEVSINPLTGEVLTVRHWGRYPLSWIYKFHYSLLSGHNGEIVVGLLGLCMLFFCISGTLLWWPRRGQWRMAWRVVKRLGPTRLFRDLHRLIGICSVPVLVLIAATGTAMVFSEPVHRLVASLLATAETPRYSVAPGVEHLSLDTLVNSVKTALPHAQLKRIFLTQSDSDSLRITLNLPGEAWTQHGASAAWINPYNGQLLGISNASTLPAGDQLLNWLFPLHNADALGLIGRWLWLLAGITPLLLFISGVILWRCKRRR